MADVLTMAYGGNRAMAVCTTCGHPLMEHMGKACYCGCREPVRGLATGAAGVGDPRIVAQPNAWRASPPAGPENPLELDQDLHLQAVATRERTERVPERTRRVPNLVAHAVAAGSGVHVNERVWALIRFAADLRALGRPSEAIQVLDAAWKLDSNDQAQLAMFTCAIAAHRDLGDLQTAQRLVDYQRERATDEKFERAAHAVAADLAAREAQTAA
jgi:hypothetical protein